MSNFAPYPPNPHDLLTFDWELVLHQRVSAVLGFAPSDAPGGWESIAFLLHDDLAVVLTVDFDTDQLTVTHRPFAPAEAAAWVAVGELAFAVGSPLGWCWEVRNYRGYLDGFILAFGEVAPGALQPGCLFLGESGISILRIAPLDGGGGEARA